MGVFRQQGGIKQATPFRGLPNGRSKSNEAPGRDAFSSDFAIPNRVVPLVAGR